MSCTADKCFCGCKGQDIQCCWSQCLCCLAPCVFCPYVRGAIRGQARGTPQRQSTSCFSRDFTVPHSRQHLWRFLLVHVREPALTHICLRAAPTASRCTMSIRTSALQDGFTFLQVLPAVCCPTGFKRVSPRVRAITPARSPDCFQGAQAGIPASDHGKKNWQINSSRRCQCAPAHTLANELDLQATCH
jgi:hypothetical protein